MKQDAKQDAVDAIAGLFALAVANRKPNISVDMPSIDDLGRELRGIYPSEPVEESPAVSELPGKLPESSEKAQAIATGCVPCSIGHVSTCSGLLNEAMRFAHSDGIESEEVISRCNMCFDELNALERVDLRPEVIDGLPDWEHALALEALTLSRTLRHELEGLSSVDALERIAARTQATRQKIGISWMKQRLSRMSPEHRKIVEDRLEQKIAEAAEENG